MQDLMRDPQIDELLDHLLSHPNIRRGIAKLTKSIDHLGQVFDGLGQAKDPGNPTSKRANQSRPQPTPPHKENPRIVLGFGPQLRLTKEMIRERRKDLARLCHPDRGGSEVAMKRINQAVEMLLSKLI